MALQYNEIDDAVVATQNLLIQRGAFTGLQTDLTDHVAVREMWQKKQKTFAGGTEWEFTVQMDHNHSARSVGLYERDGSAQHDTLVQGLIPVRHVNAHYIYDQREKAFQQGGTKIVDLVRTRYVAMMVSFFELLEDMLWGKPEDSSDKKTVWGLAYWLTKHATEGFSGGNPAGFADGRAGIDTSAYPRWANWTAQYAEISKEDLVRKMRKAARQTKFVSPVQHAKPTMQTGNGIYVNDEVIGILEELLETQNMNLGNDIASKDGRTVFKGTPITYAPKLDEDSTNPIYMLDWKTLGIGILAGWYKNLSRPTPVPGMHLVRRVDLDASLNMGAVDLRRQAVISK